MSKTPSIIGAKAIDICQFVLFLEKRRDGGCDIIALDLTNGNHAVGHLGRDTWKHMPMRLQVMEAMKDKLVSLRETGIIPYVEK